MRRAALAGVVCALVGLGGTPAHARVTAHVTDDRVVLENEVAQRIWDRDEFGTSRLRDLRDGGRLWSRNARDFTLTLAGGHAVGSDAFRAEDVSVRRIDKGGVRITMRLTPRPGVPIAGLTATRTADAYPGIAGFRTQTTLHASAPLVLQGATLDEAAPGGAVRSAIHSFRAGADWREPDWPGPPLWVGYNHPGTWRETRTAPAGQPVEGPAEWLTARSGRRALTMVAERNDLPSSRAAYDGTTAALKVDYTRDVVSLGPFEENAHVENPGGGAGRTRTVAPGGDLALEAAFTGFGTRGRDDAWQFHKYLTRHRLTPYEKAVTFNSNGTDRNEISTGAKDDMNLAAVERDAPKAKQLGIDTFILDDGWQAISGDWQPDSPDHPEPRWDGVPGSKFAPRFPDPTFAAVKQAIAPMKLGLWMSPGSFNPRSKTYAEHPDYACAPLGHALATYNLLQPDEGSNEAGVGAWGPAAWAHVEQRIRTAITDWGVRYFKFDFLLWLDCAGQGDLYEHHDAFVAMLDRIQRDHPDVTLQIDETNDYRLFPFESVSRGPSWFQNGSPPPEQLLHNVWNLSPYVPAFSLGQHFLGGRAYERYPVDTLMAAALPSHLTFFSDLRELPDDVIAQARPWIDFYKQNRELLTQMTIPLERNPLDKRWTALQSWDPDSARGALMAFRQQDPRASARTEAEGRPAAALLRAPRRPGRSSGGSGHERRADPRPARRPAPAGHGAGAADRAVAARDVQGSPPARLIRGGSDDRREPAGRAGRDRGGGRRARAGGAGGPAPADRAGGGAGRGGVTGRPPAR